ncbi:hypothetical protein [Fodinicurvata halophila]|uniref:hypothetical protein n=1 Tax=Fodinicurvata halophila TaxID=1419723 RepID=UPI00363585E8
MRDGHHGYTPANGIPELREAVAAELEPRAGRPLDPDRVLIVPGARSPCSSPSRLLESQVLRSCTRTPAFRSTSPSSTTRAQLPFH